jgi:hypothetical protein
MQDYVKAGSINPKLPPEAISWFCGAAGTNPAFAFSCQSLISNRRISSRNLAAFS